MQFDGRGPPPMGFPHPGFRMPPPGAGMRPPFPGAQMPLRPSGGDIPEGGPDEADMLPREDKEADPAQAAGDKDDDEVWRNRNRNTTAEVSAALEKARQRREEEEKRLENERKAGAAEKLRQLEQRMAAKKGDSPDKGSSKEAESPEHSDHEDTPQRSSPAQRTRTTSEDSVEKEQQRAAPKSHHGGQVSNFLTSNITKAQKKNLKEL